jgi:hypothetical protein
MATGMVCVDLSITRIAQRNMNPIWISGFSGCLLMSDLQIKNSTRSKLKSILWFKVLIEVYNLKSNPRDLDMTVRNRLLDSGRGLGNEENMCPRPDTLFRNSLRYLFFPHPVARACCH